MRTATRRDIRPEDLGGLVYAQYLRDSTPDQAEGFGPEMQRRANLAFAERYGLVDSGIVYEEYITGTTLRHRTQMMQAVYDLKAKRYAVLLVGWTHRFVRSTADAEWLKRQIREAGGVLVYTAQGFISGQRSTRLQESILHAIDQEYVDNLGDLVTAGLLSKFEADGANGHPPLGTKHVYVRRDGSIAEGPERHTRSVRVLNEAELPVLRALLVRYSQLGSYRKTADWLNQHGFRTHRGGLFTTASIKTVINNPFYGPEEIVRYHSKYPDERTRATPADQQIFPSDIHQLWESAQSNRQFYAARSAPATSRVYPLHVVLRCAHCGSVYHGHSRGAIRRTFHVSEPAGCSRPRMPRSHVLEDQLIEGLQQITLPRQWRSSIRSLLQMPHQDESSVERKRLERMIERLRYQHLCDAIDDPTFRDEFRKLRHQLERLPKQGPTELNAYREPAQLLRSVGNVLGHPAVRRREDAMRWFQRFCQLAFSRIEVEGARITKIHPQAQYRELFAVSLACQMGSSGAVERT